MNDELVLTLLFIFVLAGFLGFEVIRRVPKLLHTPLMALTNALSAIAVVAAVIVLGHMEETYAIVLGFIAVVASTINAVGGFILTDRMLRMFRRRDRPAPVLTGASAVDKADAEASERRPEDAS